jgi:prolyl 4-hydroxylase
MSITNTIPANWQLWLQENIERKVPDEKLVEVMTRARFDGDVIRRCIATFHKTPPTNPQALPGPTPLVGDWQRWLAENVARGVLERTLIDTATCEIRSAWATRLSQLREQSESQGYTYEEAERFGANMETSDRLIPVLMAIDRPRIALLGNVLSKEECEAMIALAQPRMSASVTLDNASAQPVVTKARSSDGTFLRRGETPLVERIERRIAEITRWPVAKGEGVQILHYSDGGEYVPHFDFFPPEQPGSLALLQHGGQRVATLIVYLNTAEDGGETFFPKLNLGIKPVQGNALYFSYTNSKGELDRMTLHGGNPVKKGEKWIMTKWLRQRELPRPGAAEHARAAAL